MVERSFHEAIRSGDNTARLVYADWLEDNGREPEAAMLRSGRWCLVPAGSFWMGGGGGKAGDKQVEIPQAFYLGAYPVTQGEWQDVMGNNPSYFSRDGEEKDKVKDIPDADLRQFPVEQVSWDDAQEFIKKLNEKERGSGFLYRLPSEAEWEYACRGGAISEEECSFHFYLNKPTNDLSSEQANFNGKYPVGNAPNEENLERTTKVGSYPPNRLGLHDMHGNVFEWCQDLYAKGGSGRVVRGGCWSFIGTLCQAAYRYRYAPSFRFIYDGCRLARVSRPVSDK